MGTESEVFLSEHAPSVQSLPNSGKGWRREGRFCYQMVRT